MFRYVVFLIRDACPRGVCSGIIFVSSCRCLMLVSSLHPVAMRNAVFVYFPMFVVDAIIDHMVRAYSSIGLALYVDINVS